MESTGDRRAHQVRRVASQDGPRHRLADDRDRGHQRLGVRMLRISQHLALLSPFHDLARIHDVNVLREVRDDGDVVCNQKHADAVFLLEAAKQIEDLGLDGHVER